MRAQPAAPASLDRGLFAKVLNLLNHVIQLTNRYHTAEQYQDEGARESVHTLRVLARKDCFLYSAHKLPTLIKQFRQAVGRRVPLFPSLVFRGDWVCLKCYNFNYNYRPTCPKCNKSQSRSDCVIL